MALGKKKYWEQVTKNIMDAVQFLGFFVAADFLLWPSDELVTFSWVLSSLGLLTAGGGAPVELATQSLERSRN